MQITVTYRVNTTTSVDCGSGTPVVTYGSSITCVASVTRATGAQTPGGTVNWTHTDSGNLSSSSCTLSGSEGTATCSVSYTPGSVGDGTHNIAATYAGNTSFAGSSGNQDVTVNPKSLTVSGVTANNKVYDGNTTATLNTGSAVLVGMVGGDVVTLDTSGAAGMFSDKNVGTAKTVTVSGLTLSGADAGNYTLTQPTTTADITPKSLTVSGITANDKVYDGNTSATLNTGAAALVGVIGGDVVTLNTSGAAGAFGDKNVGNGKTVIVSGLTIGGADAGNYSLTQPATTADITAKGLTVSGITANNKVYDGNTTATLNTGSAALVGVVGGDDVTPDTSSAAGTFSDKNVGTGKTVTVSGLALSGADAGNYTVTQPTTTADITAKALTVSGITANNKVYDGSTTATLNTSAAALVGVVGGDIVTLTTSGASGVFSDANVGTAKTVTVSGLTIGGADVGNYTLTQPATTADITAKALTVSGITANNKVYDGNTTATLNTGSAVLMGVIGGDDVTLDTSGAAGTFSDKNVGNGKTVTVSGLTLGGADAGNYSLTQPTTTADITAKGLTVSGITANNKVYDGNTTATLNTGAAALVGVVGGDDVTPDTSSAAGTFSDANVGTAKTVTVSGVTLSGTDAGNYTLTQPTTTADITAKGLTVSGITASNKVYDGNTTATLDTSAAALVGVVGSEDVTLDTSGAAGAFSDKNVGTSKTVTVSGLTIGGTDVDNYTLIQPTTSADITAKGLTISGITANNKVYDGNTTATLNTGSAALVGVVGGDDVTLDTSGAAGTFSDANAGTGKTVTVSGLILLGADAGNYSLTQPTTTADITPASSTTVLESSTNPSVFGASVTFTATVAPSSATGTVQFYADGAALGSAGMLSGGTASVSTAALSVGTHAITATYGGDSNLIASTSAPLVQIVRLACTSVTGVDFSYSPTAPRVGQSVTFTATVASGTLPVTYTWNFGHGADEATISATVGHSFPLTTTLQTYNVMLTTANACSNPAPVSKPVTVSPYGNYLPLISRQ
jgi:hypothetical protein